MDEKKSAAPAPEAQERQGDINPDRFRKSVILGLARLFHVSIGTATEYSDKTGNIRRHGGKLYKCVQDHTSQEDWSPDTAASLWACTSDPAEEWPAWSQPIGAHDSYSTGAKVSHQDKHWISDTDGNVWEPGVYGWTEAAEEE